MKKTISVLLLLCMFVSLFSAMAFAADETQSEAEPYVTDETTDVQLAAAVDDTQESDVKSVFNSRFYVEENADAGLKSKVVVLFDLIGTNGTLYLPGKVDASKLCFSWDDTGITVSKNGHRRFAAIQSRIGRSKLSAKKENTASIFPPYSKRGVSTMASSVLPSSNRS